jgi:hypothetical protein
MHVVPGENGPPAEPDHRDRPAGRRNTGFRSKWHTVSAARTGQLDGVVRAHGAPLTFLFAGIQHRAASGLCYRNFDR